MTSSTEFTWMHAGQLGAPQMNGAAGSNGQMLQVLDACLINGFNLQPVVSAAKTATTVTLTYGVAHGYESRQVVMVTGAADALLNGNHRIISLTVNTITIDAVNVTQVTGTITTKVAPLNFESIFGSTDPLKRAYRSKDIQSTQSVLYLDMTYPASSGYNSANPAKRAMVDICEDMTTLGTQVGSYTSAFNKKPTNRNGAMFWYQVRGGSKSEAVTDSVDRSWVIVGNGSFFYFFNNWYANSESYSRDPFMFGDFNSLAPSDGYNCLWAGARTANDAATSTQSATQGCQVGGNPSEYTRGFVMSDALGVGKLLPFALDYGARSPITYSGYDQYIFEYPNPATGGLIALPLYVTTGVSALSVQMRGIMPKFGGVPQKIPDTSLDKVCVDKHLIVISHYANATGADFGCFTIAMGD